MGIHKDIKSVVLCRPQHLDRLVDPCLVVDPRAGCLDGLPGEDVADGVVAAPFQAGEVEVRLLLWKGPADETDMVAIEEIVGHV